MIFSYTQRTNISITWLLWNATSRDVNIVVKLTFFRFDLLRSKNTHIIIMATMKTDTISNIRGSNDDWKVIETHFDGLVFRMFPSKSCYTIFLTLVQQFAIRTCKNELYQSKDCDIWKIFSAAKSTSKI